MRDARNYLGWSLDSMNPQTWISWVTGRPLSRYGYPRVSFHTANTNSDSQYDTHQKRPKTSCCVKVTRSINLAKQGYCNHFVCLSVYLFICFLCVRYATQHNTWNITRNIMMLYHEAFMYFLLGEGGGGRGVPRWGEVRWGEMRWGEVRGG